MAFARHNQKLFAAASLAVLAWTGSAAAADYTFDNVTIQHPDKKGVITIKSIDVRGSNLSKEEFAKIYDTTTSKDALIAIVKKLQADSISVPEVLITNTDKSPGAVTLRGYQVTKVNQGKFAKLALAGMDGKFSPEDGGEATIKSGPLVVEDGDFSKLIDAAIGGNIADSTSRIGKLEFRDFELRFPEKAASGVLLHTFKIGSILGSSTYAGELPLKSVAEVKNIVFIPAAQSGAAAGMAQFGYNQVDVGVKGEGTYNPATKAYDLTDFTINGVNAGAITLKGLFGNIGPEAFNGAQMARLGALMSGDVSNISLRYADNGLFDKALVFYAKMNGKDPMGVRQEWAGMVAGILPMMTGGDAGAMKIASAVSDFIKAPKSLNISIKGKGGPVRFADLQQVSDPAALLKQVEIEASANK